MRLIRSLAAVVAAVGGLILATAGTSAFALQLDDAGLPTVDPFAGAHAEEEGAHGDLAAAFWPTQSLNDRGSDVKAIQYLLTYRGYSVTVDGVFGSGTKTQVQAFQTSRGLGADGIVGSGTWGALVPTISQGASNAAVKALQMQLNEKRGAGLAVDGVFGSGTRTAVINFQNHMGISADGVVGPTTWKNLVWHYELPAGSTLCGYYASSARWGTAAAVGLLERAAATFAGTGNGRVAVGDLSLEHGGDIAGHASHEVGLDADLRPVRTDSGQCSTGCTYTQSCYDRTGTQTLCNHLRNAAPGHVRLIFFNDPSVINSGCSQYYDNHHDHLHVRWCEVVHPNSYYDC